MCPCIKGWAFNGWILYSLRQSQLVETKSLPDIVLLCGKRGYDVGTLLRRLKSRW